MSTMQEALRAFAGRLLGRQWDTASAEQIDMILAGIAKGVGESDRRWNLAEIPPANDFRPIRAEGEGATR